MKTLAETGDFLQNIILDVPDVLTSGISGSVIVHLDQSFFPERVVTLWNSLPGNRVNFSSLHKFKSSLKSIDLLSLAHWSLFLPSLCYYVHGYFVFVCFNGLPLVQLFCLVLLQTYVLTMLSLSMFANVK